MILIINLSTKFSTLHSLLNMPPIKKKPKDFLSDFFELRDYWKNRQRALFLEYAKV